MTELAAPRVPTLAKNPRNETEGMVLCRQLHRPNSWAREQ
jgi:hypothetical protein